LLLAIDFIIKRYFNFQLDILIFRKEEATFILYSCWCHLFFIRRDTRKWIEIIYYRDQLANGRDVGRVEWIRLATVRSGNVDHCCNRSRQARKSYCTANEHYSGIRIDSNLRYTSRHKFIITLQKYMFIITFIVENNCRKLN